MLDTSPGARIGPYQILGAIGKGGMGEVYRATDTRLPRDVAIKVSAQHFSERFTQEARIIAALNHPNISTLFDVGPDYLVLELVDGVTLLERLADGPLGLDEAAAIGRQIADALEYAHEHGVIHRDLKPANIKIRTDGVVKVLDFGLARVDAASGGDVDQHPTMTARATDPGTVLGTAAYMAPEQAKGKTVDKRADIWAFGCVFYEMLVGAPPYERDTSQETMASILRDDPDLTKVPAQARRLLRRCLEKDPQKRLRHIGDVMALLDEPASGEQPAGGSPVATGSGTPRRNWIWIAAMAMAMAVVVIAASVALLIDSRHRLSRDSAVAEPVMFDVTSNEKMRFIAGGAMSLSDDGHWMVFPATSEDGITRFWVRSLDRNEARVLLGTEVGSQTPPAGFAADNRSILFTQNSKLRRIDRDGGPISTLAELRGSQNGISENGKGVIALGLAPGVSAPLYRASMNGGAAVPLTALAPGETRHAFPQFLPDGRHFVYMRVSADPAVTGAYIGSIDVKPDEQNRTRVLATDRQSYYAAAFDGGGHLLFLRDGTLMAQPFDASTYQLRGEATRVADNIDSYVYANYGLFAVSMSGAVVYRTALPEKRTLSWFDNHGPVGVLGEPRGWENPAISPDGTRVAAAVGPVGRRDIHVLNLAQHTDRPLTFDAMDNDNPVWSPDSTRIIFTSTRLGTGRRLYLKPADGSQKERELSDKIATPTSWAREDVLLFNSLNTATGQDIWVLPHPGGANGPGAPVPIVATKAGEGQGQLSEDGHWIAYTSSQAVSPAIYVQAFPPPSDPNTGRPEWRISGPGSSLQPRWSSDMKHLYYETDRQMMVVDILDTTHGFQVGTPRRLFTAPQVSSNSVWALSPDGKRFLFAALPNGVGDGPFTVVLNWANGLKK
jgi:Tol biopolymer transport system component